LIDEYALVIQPVVYGSGDPMFHDLPESLRLNLMAAATFDIGTVLHLYQPAAAA
jgi:dihydrofolate reductase